MRDKINMIHNVDCLKFMKKIPDKFFDVIFLDQPFETTNNKWDVKIPQKPLWNGLNRVIKDNGIIFAFSTQPFTTEIIMGNLKNFRYELIWDKVLPVGFLNSGYMPLRSHETISIFYKKRPYYKPLMTQGHDRKQVPKRNSKNNNNYGDFESVEGYDSTERHPKSIISEEEISKDEVIETLLSRLSKYEPDSIQTFSNGGNRNKIIHSTEKPLSLALNLLRMYAFNGVEIHNEDGTSEIHGKYRIFDPTAGSGVFMEASKSLGLDYVGCEKDPIAYDKIIKRLEAVQGSLF